MTWINTHHSQIARTQKNKATNAHIGLLKAKLAKLKRELIAPTSVGGGKCEGTHFFKVVCNLQVSK